MRIVTKTNLSLAAVVAVSALLNFCALEFTIMPRFLAIETASAERNQSRAIEALQGQMDQVAASSRDYAFWDDSYAFMKGQHPDFEAKNVSAESLKALNVNYFLAVDRAGAVRLDSGFNYAGEESNPIYLLATGKLPVDHPFRLLDDKPEARRGLLRTREGIVAVGYAPILTSQRAGPAVGSLIFGKILDLGALRAATKVDFDLLPVEAGPAPADLLTRGSDKIEARTVLNGIDGRPLAMLVSTTNRQVSQAGRQAVWAAMALLALGGALLVATLALLLRRIVIARIEAMQGHLVKVAATGSLHPIPPDDRGDELSATIASFNLMAAQLADLREQLRRQDYSHGAADQAAGILHNLRNAVSPISTIAWELMQAENAPWKQNLAKAVGQLGDAGLAPERASKLNQFVTLSAAKLLEEGETRRASLDTLVAMVRHVDGILKDEDAASRGGRVSEPIELATCVAAVSKIVHGKPGIVFTSDLPPDATVVGHRIALEQVLANLLVNAADAIEASGAAGTIALRVHEVREGGAPALDISIEDTGDGIPADRLDTIFEKGFSTRRARSSGLGLHWCANAVNAMKGRLYARSAGTGLGATLHLILPQAVAELRTAA